MAFLLLLALAAAPAEAPPRERQSLDEGWRFHAGDASGEGEHLGYAALKPFLLPGAGRVQQFHFGPAFAAADFNDSSWRPLDLPHDWGVEGAFDPKGSGDTARLPYWGVGWYRRHLPLPAGPQLSHFYLQIDGAMSYSTVWVNGHLAGGWPYGYASYWTDLTPWLHRDGDNVIAVRLDNPPQSSRWYPGGGIYRNVWLLATGPTHVAQWGTFVTTPQVSTSSAAVDLQVSVEADASAGGPIRVHTAIYPLSGDDTPAGAPVAAAEAPLQSAGSLTQHFSVHNPALWSPASPARYVAITELRRADGSVLDRYLTPFGIRALTFDPDRGLLVNGEPYRIQGVCDHHDLGALGAALNRRALERQLQLLQEMGCNAIRTSHNPPAPELLDLCDKLGFLVMDESFDCWKKAKRPNDYHLLFADWHDADLRALIHRDRNHPSVMMWSIGNEIPEQKDPVLGPQIGHELQRIVHEEDGTRPATSACNDPHSSTNGFFDVVDVFGYNYHWEQYAAGRKLHPHTFLYGSETSSTVSSRGVYVYPVSDDKKDGLWTADHQVSSYDLSAPRWAWPPDDEFRAEDENPGMGGEFVWTGWDYLGEPTPYGKGDDPARSSYFGIIDLAGFKKDRFYLYQARWRPKHPMAHLVPHWTWPDRVGQVTPVFVYTSGDEAELFLNGKSQGRRHKGAHEYRLRWDKVVYQPGELRVVAYRQGQRWAEDVQRTAAAPKALAAAVDRKDVRGDAQDLAFVRVSIVDGNRRVCPRAQDEVQFTVDGPADVIAVDNGDATSFEPFQATRHRAFNGWVLAIVRPRRGASGDIAVSAAAAGLKTAVVHLSAGK